MKNDFFDTLNGNPTTLTSTATVTPTRTSRLTSEGSGADSTLKSNVASKSRDRNINRVIYGCDFGCDGDDMLGLALLHHLHNTWKIEFLGVGFSMTDRMGPAGIDVVNTYYKRPDFPIGITKVRGTACDLHSTYLAKNYKHLWNIDLDNVPNVVNLYRRLLADSPDQSVTFACVGYKQNFAELLRSRPDKISPLNGVELVRRKVKYMSDMGGGYPSAVDNGCNFKSHSKHARYFVDHWPTPIIFTGIRWDLELGEQLMKQDNPVGRGLKERMRQNKKYPNYPRQPSWDVIAALVAAEGWEPHFNVSKSGQNVLDDQGNNWFGYEKDRRHRFIESAKIPKNELRDLLDEMLLAKPAPRPVVRRVIYHDEVRFASSNGNDGAVAPPAAKPRESGSRSINSAEAKPSQCDYR